MRLYGKYFIMQLKMQMQYPLNFLLVSLGQFLTAFSAFLGVYFLSLRFGDIGGFSLGEVLLCAGVVLMAFALTECFFRGFDTFGSIVSTGKFDRIMLRPRGCVLQVLGQTIEFTRLGRLIQATIMLVWGVQASGVAWNPGKAAALLLMIAGGISMFASFFMIYAAICFVTIEGLEFMNIFTDGGREAGQYPIQVYGREALVFFTYILPLAFVQMYPILWLTGRSANTLFALAPAVCFIMPFPAYALWRLGIKRYSSAGS